MTQLARFRNGTDVQWGLVEGDELVVLGGNHRTTGAVLARGRDDVDKAKSGEGTRVSLSSVSLLSPITSNQQVVAVGANYRKHMIESGMRPEDKTYNMLFRKASSCLSGANDPIKRPSHVELLDYEVELGLVMGRDVEQPETYTGNDLPESVAALVVHNDVSARCVQVPQMQFYKGKSYRTFGPTGPYLTLVDEKLRQQWGALRLVLKVNGEVRQDEFASEMVFGPAPTLTEITHLQSLQAGDLIATGTPSGVALKAPKPLAVRVVGLLPDARKWALFKKIQHKSGRYLRNGDVVEASIRTGDRSVDLGTLCNRVEAAAC